MSAVPQLRSSIDEPQDPSYLLERPLDLLNKLSLEHSTVSALMILKGMSEGKGDYNKVHQTPDDLASQIRGNLQRELRREKRTGKEQLAAILDMLPALKARAEFHYVRYQLDEIERKIGTMPHDVPEDMGIQSTFKACDEILSSLEGNLARADITDLVPRPLFQKFLALKTRMKANWFFRKPKNFSKR